MGVLPAEMTASTGWRFTDAELLGQPDSCQERLTRFRTGMTTATGNELQTVLGSTGLPNSREEQHSCAHRASTVLHLRHRGRHAVAEAARPGYFDVQGAVFRDKNGVSERRTVHQWDPADPAGPTFLRRDEAAESSWPADPPASWHGARGDPVSWPTSPEQLLTEPYRRADEAIAAGLTSAEPRDAQAGGLLHAVAMNPCSSPDLVGAVFQAASGIPGTEASRDITTPRSAGRRGRRAEPPGRQQHAAARSRYPGLPRQGLPPPRRT